MGTWEIVAVVIGALASAEVARRTAWRALKGLVRLGDGLPELQNLPATIAGLRTEMQHLHEESVATRVEVREHMKNEDRTAGAVEKVLANMVGRQERMKTQLEGLDNELRDLRLIVMNVVESGSGDRDRLRRHVQSEPAEPS